MATDTTVEHKMLGFAAPNYGNKPLAELAQSNIEAVGMPKWTADDQAFAKLVQETQRAQGRALARQGRAAARRHVEERVPTGGGSDDIGDIMWTVPTITMRYPSNIPNMIGHNVTSAMAMATPDRPQGRGGGRQGGGADGAAMRQVLKPEMFQPISQFGCGDDHSCALNLCITSPSATTYLAFQPNCRIARPASPLPAT